MATAFVLGNGVSRQGIDLSALSAFGKIYGCNALYREFAPSVLVATDRAISEAIQSSGYALDHVFYTRKPAPDSGAQLLPDHCWKYSSGPAAVFLAAQHGHSKLFLLGFDMGPNINGKFNNVYADTEFYKKSTDVPTYTGNWIDQLIEVAKKFPRTEFVRVTGVATAAIKSLEALPNLAHMPLQQFRESHKYSRGSLNE